jgi:hypothetical protein
MDHGPESWDGMTLLELCEQCGLATPADYVIWPGVGAVVTNAGECRLKALAKHDFALAEAVFDAGGRQLAAVLAGSGANAAAVAHELKPLINLDVSLTRCREVPVKSLITLASRTGFEPVLPT